MGRYNISIEMKLRSFFPNKIIACPDQAGSGKKVNLSIKIKYVDLSADVAFHPDRYISYDRFVKKAIKDYRPTSQVFGLMQFAVQCFPCAMKGNAQIFKIDGGYLHKKLADRYIMLSPSMLEAYGKTPEEFMLDWKKCHPNGK